MFVVCRREKRASKYNLFLKLLKFGVNAAFKVFKLVDFRFSLHYWFVWQFGNLSHDIKDDVQGSVCSLIQSLVLCHFHRVSFSAFKKLRISLIVTCTTSSHNLLATGDRGVGPASVGHSASFLPRNIRHKWPNQSTCVSLRPRGAVLDLHIMMPPPVGVEKYLEIESPAIDSLIIDYRCE